MTGDELIQEGRRFARPCVTLDNGGTGEAVAVWGGAGTVPAPDGPYRHWLSVGCRFLPQRPLGLSGVFSIYSNEGDGETGVMAVDGSASISAIYGGLLLFRRPALSLPPIDAVFLYGSAAVQEWLAGNAWRPGAAYNDKFPDRETARVYKNAWTNQCPLYQQRPPHAALGGWHMPWPEGDWPELSDKQLLAWTFKGAEPWVEAWADNEGQFAVIQRTS